MCTSQRLHDGALASGIAHRFGPQEWHIEGAGVQGHNVRFCGLNTMGECWHNNHHAFPDSAQLGLHPWQSDPGWWLIQLFQYIGLAWDMQTPDTLQDIQSSDTATNLVSTMSESST